MPDEIVESVAPSDEATEVKPASPGQPPVGHPESDEDEPSLEADSVEVKGNRYVPVKALAAERKAKQKAKKEARAARNEAERLSSVQEQLNQALPYIQRLRDHPELMEERRAQPEPTAPSPEETAELEDLARTVGLYDAQAKPDIKAAQKVASLIRRESQRAAKEAVQPLEEVTAQERSQLNYQRALALKSPEGRSPKKETLDFMWKNMPPSYSADPRVAAIMAYAAMGYDVAHGPAPGPKPPDKPPLETEGAGSRIGPGRSLSDFERSVAADRGKTESQWRELTKGHQSGRPFVLED